MISLTFGIQSKRSNNVSALADTQIDPVRSSFGQKTLTVEGREYTLSCLKTADEVAGLQEAWENLYHKMNTPFAYFQSFDWCFSWANEVAPHVGAELQVYVVSDQTSPVLIIPMALNKPNSFVRTLSMLGEPLGQYSGLVCDADRYSHELGKAALKCIKEQCGCDAIVFSHCPVDSLLGQIIKDQGHVEEPRSTSSILDYRELASWDEHHASLPRSSRKERNKRRNKLSSVGKVDYRVVPASSSEYPALVEKCLEFKKVWLKKTGRLAGNLGREQTRKFLSALRCVSDGNTPEFGAMVHCLYLDGEPIGMELGMVSANDYYSYLGAIDWSLRAYSPGKVQIEFTQKWAMESGINRFDFLNDPSDYKAHWTNAKHDLISVNIPLSAKGYVYSRFWKALIRPRLTLFYQKTTIQNRERFNRLSARFLHQLKT